MTEIENLYVELYNTKVKMISRILRGDYSSAEDVVQEAFARALKFYPSYDEERGTIQTWFNAILFNSLRDHQRSKYGDIPSDVNNISPEDIISFYEIDRTLINSMVNSVDNKKHKRVLELFFVMGYTSSEISQIEDGISVSNVTTIVNRFREKMKND